MARNKNKINEEKGNIKQIEKAKNSLKKGVDIVNQQIKKRKKGKRNGR